MLPALFRKSANPSKGAFSRALARFRNNRALARARLEEQRALQAARKWEEVFQSAAKPEEVTVRGRCTVTGRTYRTLYRRAPEDGKFVPVAQSKDEHSRDHPKGGRNAAPTDPAIAVDEFRHMTRAPCPWCGKRLVHSEIRCGTCRQWVCSGRGYVDRAGTLMHVCHEDCGTRAPVGPTVKSIEAERTVPKNATGKALAHPTERLSGPADMLEHSRKRRP